MAGPARVFISYSSKDADLVERLKSALAQAGADVWLDHERLTPDTLDWQEAIRKGILQATHVIYVASPTAARSQNVIHEIEMARGESKHIIAFWVRGEKWYDCVPFGWILAQRTDGRNAAYADGLAKLLNALGITSKAPAVAFPQQTPPQELSETLLRQHAEVKELPNIVPVGARFGAMERDMRLETSTRHMIYVQNIGGHVASRIYAVLFPSVMYFNHQGMSQGNPPLWGAYWQGYSRGSLRPGERGFTVLEQSQRPMMGDLRVAPQFTLYAPIQPSPEERHAGTHFYSARLTITYASSASGIGPNFVTIFDLDADHLAQNRKDIWDQILLPTEVEKDLVGVVYDWEQKQQPPI